MNLLNNKIIGLHKGGHSKFKINKGTYLKYPINEFINKFKNIENKINENNESKINNNNLKDKNIKNEIEIELKVDKNDKNKNIYFLDNTDYIEDKSEIKYYHDNLRELNELNADLYINDKKY